MTAATTLNSPQHWLEAAIASGTALPGATQASASQAAVVTTAPTNSTPYGYSTSAQALAIITLVNAIRTALVDTGIIKGSA